MADDAPKLAFLFPGQGSQKVGMAEPLAAADGARIETALAAADAASGLPIARLVAEGPIEELTRTDVAQPALFTVALAVADVARELGLQPGYVAGHSLGEYTAAVAAGALDRDAGLALVCRRGRLMAASQDERPGAMAAIMGLPAEQVAELCGQASEAGLVAPANVNSPRQIVASGEEAGVERLIELATAAGARRAMRLNVGAAFHSALLEPTQQRMAETMASLDFRDPDPPLVANASGDIVRTADAVRDALITQIASPVLWLDGVRTLRAAGVTTFLELGPGRVLSGLVRQIDPDAEYANADSREALEAFAEAHPQFL